MALGPVLAASGAMLPAAPAVAVAAGVTAAATAASVATAAPAHAQSGEQVLVLVQNGETNAPEAALLQAAGYSVTEATPSVWAGMSTAAFEGYAALVIGDPSSAGLCSSLLPTTGTSGSDALGSAWQAAVNGNVAVLGTAPVLPGTSASDSLITDSVEYAAAGWNSANSGSNTSDTGLYVSLNCEYATATAGTDVSLLDGVEGIGTDGGLTVQGNLACGDPGTVNTWEVAKAGTYSGFTSSDLATSAWGTACPVQEAFGSWPAMFNPVAYDAASDVTANFTASDGGTGQPYVLLGTPVSSATAALAPSVGGEVLGGTTSGGTSNPAAPGVDQAAAGDPVNTENGDFTQSDADLSLPGFGPALNFSRTYDANLAQQQTQTQTPGPMGYGWTDNWATSLSTARPTPGDIYAADGMRLDGGDGGLGVGSLTTSPEGVYWASNGDVYIADTGDNRIQEIAASNESEWGINMTANDVYTVAGQADGQDELPQDQGHANGLPATSIVLNHPRGITLDPEGDLIITDTNNARIVEIAANNQTQWGISMNAGDAYTIAGNTGVSGQGGLDGPATSADLVDPTSVHMGQGSGVSDLYIADGSGNRILVMPGENESAEWGQSGSWTGGYLYQVAGDGVPGVCANGRAAAGACLNDPQGVTINGTNMYIADTQNNRIVEVPGTSTSSQWGVGASMTEGDVYTVAGMAGGAGGADSSGAKAIGDDLSLPTAVRDPNGNLYITDSGNSDVVEVAGSTHSEWGLNMTADYLYQVQSWESPADLDDLWVDSSGDIYVPVAAQDCVYVVEQPTPLDSHLIAGGNRSGDVGPPTLANAGDDGAAVNASLNAPTATATDSHGDVYIADAGNERVQEIAAYSHTQFGIAMLAGDTYTIASGTGGAADTNPAVTLVNPVGLAVDSSGDVYIADADTYTVDVLDPAGNLSVFAGTGNSGAFSGNGTAAAGATLGAPSAVAVDASGDVFIADSGNNGVLEVPATTTSQMTAGDIYAVAGAAATTPSGLSVTGTTTTSVSLSWKASTGTVTGYAVYENGATTPVTTTSGTGTTATVTGLSPSTTYTFTVAALGVGGIAGSQSTSVTATTNMLPPAPPTGLTVTGTTDNSVSLSWTAPSGTVSGYNVYENGGSTVVATSTSTSATVTGLSASTTYTFTVEATNPGGSSTLSASVSAATAPPPPAAPSGLTVTGTMSTTVSLSWTAPSGPVTGYYVYQVEQTLAGSVEEQLPDVTVTGTTAVVAGLSKSTSYTLNVAAYNVSGAGSYSSTVTARTGSTSAPGAPTGLAVSGVTSSSVSLSWTAPSGTVTGYYVYENGGSASVASSTSTSVTVAGLSASTTYTFTVAAYNSGGTGTTSSSVPATTSAPPVAPGAPAGLTVTGSNDTSVSLSWTAPPGTVTGYYVYENGGAVSVAASTSTSVTVTGLSVSTGYTFTVAAYNSAGTGTSSSSVPATTTALPGAPSGLTVTGMTSGSVSLSWTAPPGTVTGYYVYENGGSTSVASSSSTSVTVTGLTVSTTYTFTVASYDANGASAQSSPASATTGAASKPAAPTNLTATLVTDTSVSVSWTAPAGTVTGYYVYEEDCDVTECDGKLTKVATVTGTGTTFSGLTEFDMYGFAVAAYNSAGTGAETSEVYVETGSPLAVKAGSSTQLATPAGLSATPASATSVTLTWTKPASTTFGGYYVYENGTEVTTVSSAKVSSFTVSGLASATKYKFSIAEYDGASTGAQSSPATATTPASGGKTSAVVPLYGGGASDSSGSTGNGGPATAALLDGPAGIAVDPAGNIYISDSGNNEIREIAAATGTQHGQAMTAGDIYAVAGNSTTTVTGAACPAYVSANGDQGPAVCAALYGPEQVAVDQAGDLYIADTGNAVIREVPAASGTQWSQSMTAGDIYDIAGVDGNDGASDSTGDGSTAATTFMNLPYGMSADPYGDLFILQQGGGPNGLVPQLQEIAATATLSIPAGSGQTSSLYPLDTPGGGGGITIAQPGDSQVTFYAQLPTGGCPSGYNQVDSYCLSGQDTSATLTSNSGGNWVYTPTAGGDSYTYPQSGGQMISETDTAGITLTITQNTPAPGSGQCPSTAASCETILAASGRTLVVGSSSAGLITSVTDPMGRSWSYQYNSADQLTSATDPMTNVTSYTYGAGTDTNQDLANDLLTITSPNGQSGGPDAGKSTINVYDNLGRVVTQTDPMGWKTSFNYCVNFYDGDCMDPASGSGYVTVTDPDNNKTIYGYTSGTLASEAQYTAAVVTSEHDYDPLTWVGVPSGGTLLDISTTDGDGNTTTYAYNTLGQVTSTTAPSPDGPAVTSSSYTDDEDADCVGTPETPSSSTCVNDTGPSPVEPGGVITPPSTGPPEGLAFTLYDTDGNELYTTTGVYEPGSSSAAYFQTNYQLFNGNTVALSGTTISCAAKAPAPSLPCAQINADYAVTQLVYDAAGDLISSSTPDGNGAEIATSANAYNADGELTSTTTPDGNLSGANAGNYTTVTAYNADGEKTTITQAGGSGATATPRVITYTYDGDGDQTGVKDGRGYTTTTIYNADDKPSLVTNPDGDATLTCYDGDGNTAQTVPPVGVAANSLTASSCPTSYPSGYGVRLVADATVATYNVAREQVQQATPAPAGQSGFEITTYAYDGAGNTVEIDAPPAMSGGLNQITIDTYNSANQLATQTVGYGISAASTTTFCYNPNGDRTAVVAPDGNTSGIAACEGASPWIVNPSTNPNQAAYQTTYSYDSDDELVTTTAPASAADPNGATTTYTYDAAGNPLTSTDPDNITTTYTYTPTGKQAKISYSGSAAAPITFSYDADGDKTAMTDTSGNSTYQYDPFGELTQVTNGANETVTYNYDSDGDVTSIGYPLPSTATWAQSGSATFGYDEADKLNTITDFSDNTITVTDNADGLPASEKLGSSGDTITTGYDSAGSPSTIALANSGGTLQSFNYADAPSGNILTETDTPSSAGTPLGYGYDAQGRVTSNTPGNETADDYQYDASGNLTTLPNGAAGTYNQASELTSATFTGAVTSYTYNADGERLAVGQGGTTTASGTWNGAKEVTAYDDSSAQMAGATYDGDGLRASASFTPANGSAVTESYVWGGDRLLMDSANAYIYGNGSAPAEQVNLTTGTIDYLVSDSLGSVRGTVNSSGALTGTTSYDAWGNSVSNGGLKAMTPFGFAGGYTDPDGLVYLINRYYDPISGQFLSADPEVSETEQPYAYSDDDPANSTDPSGMFTIGFCVGGGFVIPTPWPFPDVVAAAGACLNRTRFEHADDIGLTGTVGFGGGAGAPFTQSASMYYEFSNATTLQELGGPFDFLSVSGSVYGIGVGLTVFWGGSPLIYGVDFALGIGDQESIDLGLSDTGVHQFTDPIIANAARAFWDFTIYGALPTAIIALVKVVQGLEWAKKKINEFNEESSQKLRFHC